MISDYPARGEGDHPPITNRCSKPPTISATGLATLAATEFPRSDVIRPHVHGNQPRPPLIPLKQIARINLTGHIGQLVAPAVGDDHVALGLEGLKIVRYLAAEELGRVQRGLYTTTGTPLASMRFMMPCTLDARKLSEPVFIVRRYTPATGLGLPS